MAQRLFEARIERWRQGYACAESIGERRCVQLFILALVSVHLPRSLSSSCCSGIGMQRENHTDDSPGLAV
jgi:hypothetical protein